MNLIDPPSGSFKNLEPVFIHNINEFSDTQTYRNLQLVSRGFYQIVAPFPPIPSLIRAILNNTLPESAIATIDYSVFTHRRVRNLTFLLYIPQIPLESIPHAFIKRENDVNDITVGKKLNLLLNTYLSLTRDTNLYFPLKKRDNLTPFFREIKDEKYQQIGQISQLEWFLSLKLQEIRKLVALSLDTATDDEAELTPLEEAFDEFHSTLYSVLTLPPQPLERESTFLLFMQILKSYQDEDQNINVSNFLRLLSDRKEMGEIELLPFDSSVDTLAIALDKLANISNDIPSELDSHPMVKKFKLRQDEDNEAITP